MENIHVYGLEFLKNMISWKFLACRL